MKSSPRHSVIYIPGLFDRVRWVQYLQRQALKSWRVFGVQPEVFVMGWSSDTEFDERIEALLKLIEDRVSQGDAVSLVGASAGASAVLAVLEREPAGIAGAVLICGKIHRPHVIPDVVFDVNEVFEQGLEEVEDALAVLSASQRTRLLSLRARLDGIVPPQDSIIEGAVNKAMPVFGHVPGIGFALLRYGRLIAKFCANSVVETSNRDLAD